MDKSDKDAPATDRRGFLKLAGLGSVAAGTAAVTGGSAAASGDGGADPVGGYRETPHVKTYYANARF